MSGHWCLKKSKNRPGWIAEYIVEFYSATYGVGKRSVYEAGHFENKGQALSFAQKGGIMGNHRGELVMIDD